jgi:hypothetical protein
VADCSPIAFGHADDGGGETLRQLPTQSGLSKLFFSAGVVLGLIAVRGAMSETRKLAAILCSDVVGCGWLAGADEDHILTRLRTPQSDLVGPTIAVHNGHGQAHRRRQHRTRVGD